MFGSNRKFLSKVDELESRTVEQARQIKELSDENKELKELRLNDIRNNTKLIKENDKKEKLIQEITLLVTQNTYNREDVLLAKIKELVRDYQSKN